MGIVQGYQDPDYHHLGIFRYPVIEEETLNPIHGVMAEVPKVNNPPTNPTPGTGINSSLFQGNFIEVV